MDPVSLIVMALAAGAAAGLKPTAAEAVRDAYAGIKRLIQGRYANVQVEPLEQRPESEAKRASLTEDLDAAGASTDEELIAHARELITLVQQHDPGVGAAIGIDLEHVSAVNLRIGKVDAEGTGVRIREGTFAGDIDIGEVRAGRGGPEPVNPP